MFQGEDFTRCSQARSVSEKASCSAFNKPIAVNSVSITSAGRSRSSRVRQIVGRSAGWRSFNQVKKSKCEIATVKRSGGIKAVPIPIDGSGLSDGQLQQVG